MGMFYTKTWGCFDIKHGDVFINAMGMYLLLIYIYKHLIIVTINPLAYMINLF